MRHLDKLGWEKPADPLVSMIARMGLRRASSEVRDVRFLLSSLRASMASKPVVFLFEKS